MVALEILVPALVGAGAGGLVGVLEVFVVDFLLLEPQAVARNARTATTSSRNDFLTATSVLDCSARPYLRDMRRRENLEGRRDAISRSGRSGAVAVGAVGAPNARTALP